MPLKLSITFIRAGEKAQHQPSSSGGLLATARDWQLQVDLGRQVKSPENIASTPLCPHMVLTSESTKRVVLLELTVPWEDRTEEAKSAKGLDTQILLDPDFPECWSNG